MLFGTLTAVFALVRGALSGTSFAGPVLTVPVHAIPLPLPSSELALLQIHICGEFGETSPEYLRALAALSAAAGPGCEWRQRQGEHNSSHKGGGSSGGAHPAAAVPVHPAERRRAGAPVGHRVAISRAAAALVPTALIQWNIIGRPRRSSAPAIARPAAAMTATARPAPPRAAARPTGVRRMATATAIRAGQLTATRAARTTCRER